MSLDTQQQWLNSLAVSDFHGAMGKHLAYT